MKSLDAWRFLTVIRIPGPFGRTEEIGASATFFPLVGLVLGAILAGLDYLLQMIWPSSIASALVIVALILMTGGLHLDGLMDSCDGLFGRNDPNRRLEIMRDSRVGSFGVLGVISILLVKYAALVAIWGPARTGALLVAPMLGRWAMALAMWYFPYARAQGLGSAFKASLRWPHVIVGGLFALAIAAVVLSVAGVVLFVITMGLTFLIGWFIGGRIPGLTGDSYGAINEIVEVAVILALGVLVRMV